MTTYVNKVNIKVVVVNVIYNFIVYNFHDQVLHYKIPKKLS